MRRTPLLLLLSLALLLVCTSPAWAGGTYTDTEGHWAAASIETWSDRG